MIIVSKHYMTIYDE